MAKQLNPNTTSGKPVYSRDDLAKAQARINSEKEASREQHESDIAKLDRAFAKQANTPTNNGN